MIPAKITRKEQPLVVTRDQIKALERAIITELEPVDTPLEHHFIPGVYIRKLTLPAGTVLTGKVHSTIHGCIVAKGRILVASEEGGTKELVAGDVFVSHPGVKRAGYAIEDTVFINVHANAEETRDLEVLEAQLIAPEALEYTKVEVLA
jgi:quercetin dioxygenase-like cupin family protein